MLESMANSAKVKKQVLLAMAGAFGGAAFAGIVFSGPLMYIFGGIFALTGFIVGANVPTGKTENLVDSTKLIRMTDQARMNQEQQIRQTLELIQKQRAAMETLVFRISEDTLRTQGDGILRVYQSFARAVQEDPKDARPVRRFLNYYGETGLEILKRYHQLNQLPRTEQTLEVRESLTRISQSLTELKGAFELQLQKLMDNDLLELDTELTVLEKTIALEGLKKPDIVALDENEPVVENPPESKKNE